MFFPQCLCAQCQTTPQPTFAGGVKPEMSARKYYYIVNKQNNQCIEYVQNSDPQQAYIMTREKRFGNEQLWRLAQTNANGSFLLVNKSSGTTLSSLPVGPPPVRIVDSGNTGNSIGLYTEWGIWQLKNQKEGYFDIEYNGFNSSSGVIQLSQHQSLIVADRSNSDFQKWKFMPA